MSSANGCSLIYPALKWLIKLLRRPVGTRHFYEYSAIPDEFHQFGMSPSRTWSTDNTAVLMKGICTYTAVDRVVLSKFCSNTQFFLLTCTYVYNAVKVFVSLLLLHHPHLDVHVLMFGPTHVKRYRY